MNISRKCLEYAASILLLCVDARGAEIFMSKFDSIVFNGKIEKGDYSRLVKIIGENSPRDVTNFVGNPRIILDSPGGDIEEAEKISELVSDLHANVLVARRCYGACVLIAFSSPRRVFFIDKDSVSSIGISNFFLEVSDTLNRNSHDALNRQWQLKLRLLEVPPHLIDHFITRVPGDPYILTRRDLLDMGRYKPSFNSIRVAKCSADVLKERELDSYLLGLSSNPPNLNEGYFHNVNECWRGLFIEETKRAILKHLDMEIQRMRK